MATTRSTAEIKLEGPLQLHGEIGYRIEGRILQTTAIGPFNNEMVAAIPAVISELITKLVQQGKWGQIITFQRSASGTPAAVANLGAHLKARYSNPENNPVTALVFGRSVEGGALMAPQFLKCYLDAGVESRIFEDYSTALYWVESRIKQTSKVLTWNDSYRIGEPAIDEQHQEIFLRAGDVIAATSRDGQTMCSIRLQQYALTHFSHEEELMRKMNYPDMEHHVEQHRMLISKLAEVTKKIANDNLVKAELEELIAHWLLRHIGHSDAQLAAYLKS